jgi:hypothetical protein
MNCLVFPSSRRDNILISYTKEISVSKGLHKVILSRALQSGPYYFLSLAVSSDEVLKQRVLCMEIGALYLLHAAYKTPQTLMK